MKSPFKCSREPSASLDKTLRGRPCELFSAYLSAFRILCSCLSVLSGFAVCTLLVRYVQFSVFYKESIIQQTFKNVFKHLKKFLIVIQFNAYQSQKHFFRPYFYLYSLYRRRHLCTGFTSTFTSNSAAGTVYR